MAKINKDVAAAVMDGAALNTQSKLDTGTEEEVQRQTMVYDIPKTWIKAIREKERMTVSAFARQAIKEKLQREGHI